MTATAFRFDRFTLHPADRRLTRDGAPVDLNARYLDALALLVRADGALVSKDRFMDEVWRGVPVTDEALTQCIRTLRRQLGDDAANPRFIATVPKHGYRFIAPVSAASDDAARAAVSDPPTTAPATRLQRTLPLATAGAGGGAVAGAVGGMIYGFTFDAQPAQPGIGAASVLIVLLLVCAIVGGVGGAGVGGGIAVARTLSGTAWRWAVVGGAAGGVLVGAVVKLLGIDAFDLLLGRSPGDITGAIEGGTLGAAVGLGGWLASLGSMRPAARAAVAAVTGGLAGTAIGLAGGRLMGGSLDLLARGFHGSRLRMDQIGRGFGESEFGPRTLAVTGGLEGALFAGCVVTALILAARRRSR